MAAMTGGMYAHANIIHTLNAILCIENASCTLQWAKFHQAK